MGWCALSGDGSRGLLWPGQRWLEGLAMSGGRGHTGAAGESPGCAVHWITGVRRQACTGSDHSSGLHPTLVNCILFGAVALLILIVLLVLLS